LIQVKKKKLGAFYTSELIVDFLTKWAIHSPNDKIIDPCIGKGAFIHGALKQLAELGRNPKSAINQIFGVEYDQKTYSSFLTELNETYHVTPKKIQNFDFFDIKVSEKLSLNNTTIPLVDVAIGNPPYIERQRHKKSKKIRTLLRKELKEYSLHSVTDMYVYFLIHAASFLKNGGRFAFIVSDTWMNMNYGVGFKKFLLENFRIKSIIGFKKRVFLDAQVRTVLLLCEKSNQSVKNLANEVDFVLLDDASDLDHIPDVLNSNQNNRHIKILKIKQSSLSPNEQWGSYLRGSNEYFKLINNQKFVKLQSIARTGIGVQTLRKNFFILKEKEVKSLNLEKEYFDKIALSIRTCSLVVKSNNQIRDYVLLCDKTKSQLKNTNTLNYIEEGERKEITPVGSTKTILGYHNIPRIQQAGRKPWYNLTREVNNRCKMPIMFPRRIFERFFAVWNKAKMVTNEDFIGIEPFEKKHLLPLLAILNSTLTELFVRVRSQIYGGGVFDLRPEDVKNLPVLDLNSLSSFELKNLENAYLEFIQSEGKKRKQIDQEVMKILEIRKVQWGKIVQDNVELTKLPMMLKKMK